MNKKILISGIALTAIAGIIFMTIGIQGFQKNKTNETIKNETPIVKVALTVNVESPKIQNIPLKITSSGTIVPWQESIIGSELSGVAIKEIYVDIGSVVTKGQLLAKLNSQSINADMNQVRATIQEANANFQESKANADIARNIEKTNALSGQQIKKYLTNEMTARARVASAQASFKSQSVRLSQTNILAPEDGIVSARTAAVGNIVNQGEMFRIIVQEKLQWKAQVPSEDIIKITKDMPVEIKTTTNEIIQATVSEISPTVDMQTRQGTVYVNLDKEMHMDKVKSGMFVEGNINLGFVDKVMIPQQAIVLRDGFSYIFLVKNNVAVQTKVTTGDRFGNDIEINGIEVTDKVVVTGATFLKDQDNVKVVETK